MKRSAMVRIAVFVLALGACVAVARERERGGVLAAQHETVVTSAAGVGEDAWRYQWYGGRWWYWLPEDRWAYWDNGQWWSHGIVPSTSTAPTAHLTGMMRSEGNDSPSHEAVASSSAGVSASNCPTTAAPVYGGYDNRSYGSATPWGTPGTASRGGGVSVPGWR